MSTAAILPPPSSPEDASYDPHLLLGEFHTGLWLPKYPQGRCGAWSVKRIMMAAARGYWGKVYRMNGTVMLVGPGAEGKSAWMAMTPSEIESQELGLAAAHGHTVVLGMGMGWLAGNAALKPEVAQVTIVERNPDVLALMASLQIFEQLPADVQEKIAIVEADALEWRPDGNVDSLQADIWEHFVEPDKLAEARRMQDHIEADRVYFWGQEMEIWRLACRRAGHGAPVLDRAVIETIVAKDMALPLILPDWPDLGEKITAAAPWWTPKEPDWWR